MITFAISMTLLKGQRGNLLRCLQVHPYEFTHKSRILSSQTTAFSYVIVHNTRNNIMKLNSNICVSLLFLYVYGVYLCFCFRIKFFEIC